MVHRVLYFYIMICVALIIFNLSYILKQRFTQSQRPHFFDHWKKGSKH